MKSVPLATLQRQMSEAIHSVELTAKLLESLGIVDQAPIQAAERMGIYRTAFAIRMSNALEEDFPETRELLGEKKFARLVKNYLAEVPSRSWTLAELGEALPEFVAQSDWSIQYPYLADLTRLEWSRVLADHGGRTECLDPKRLEQLSESELSDLELALSPSVRLLRCDWAVHADRSQRATCLAIYRAPSDEIRELELSEKQWMLLKKLSTGLSLEETVTALPEVAPEWITSWFSTWVAKGIVIHRFREGAEG